MRAEVDDIIRKQAARVGLMAVDQDKLRVFFSRVVKELSESEHFNEELSAALCRRERNAKGMHR